MSSSESAFRLTKKERRVSRILIQNKRRGYRYAIRCEINFDNVSIYPSAILAYAEYYVYFIIRKKYRNKIKQRIHIFDISSIHVIDRDSIEIHFSYHIVQISSSGLNLFTHILFRIIAYSTKFLPNRIILAVYNSTCYPSFEPDTSISQQFQMYYDGVCSYLQKPYFHEFVLFFHRIITTENVILDLTYLPCYILMSSWIDNKNLLEPFFKAIASVNFFVGIACQNCYMPKVLQMLAPLISVTKSVRFISLTNLGITQGAKELAKAIKKNTNLDLISIDLSGNRISDLEYFTKALRYLKKPLYSLNLSNCNLSKTATENLVISLMLNPNLQYLKHFDIYGANMSSKFMMIFTNYFHQASTSMHRIHLGKADNRLNIFLTKINSIQFDNPALESFSLSGTDLRSIGIEQLKIFICGTKTLKELDLSSTNLSPYELSQIIHSIGQNGEINKFALHLNNLNLNKHSLDSLLQAFDERNIRKWAALSFESNNLSSQDFHNLLQVLNRMSNLITLNIGLNFSVKTDLIESYLPNVLSLSKLERLSIRGSEKCYLTFEQLHPFVKTLSLLSNRAIRLNVKDNKIGSRGYRDMKNLVLAKKLIELQIDGNCPDLLSDIINLCEVVRESNDMNLMNFPLRDAMRLIRKLPKKSLNNLADFELKRRLMMEKLQFKLTRHGIHSTWTLNGITEIEEVVDHQTKLFHSFLKKNNTTFHSFGCRTLGIPFPFIDENANFEDNIEKIVQISDPEITNVYRIYNALYDSVEEKSPENKGILYSYLSFKNSENCENACNMLSDFDYSSKSRKVSTKLFSFDEEEQKGSLYSSNSKTKSDENDQKIDHFDQKLKRFSTNSTLLLPNNNMLFSDSIDDSYEHFS